MRKTATGDFSKIKKLTEPRVPTSRGCNAEGGRDAYFKVFGIPVPKTGAADQAPALIK